MNVLATIRSDKVRRLHAFRCIDKIVLDEGIDLGDIVLVHDAKVMNQQFSACTLRLKIEGRAGAKNKNLRPRQE